MCARSHMLGLLWPPGNQYGRLTCSGFTLTNKENKVSASVIGSVLQAGAVHGDAHFHGAEAAPLIPRQLGAPPVHFANRRRELADLADAAAHGAQRVPIVLLKGQAGVGKTALALRWFDEARDRFPHGELYAELTQPTGEPVAPDEVLGQFLRALGVLPERMPVSLAERTTLFRSLTADRKLGVLLDDAVSAAQVRVLVPSSAASLVVVTSRRPLIGLLAGGAVSIQVDPLDDAGAIELLERHMGAERVATERRPAEDLIRLCGGLPLALVVAVALTLSRPSRSLAWMARELADSERRLDVLSAEEDLSLRSTFDLSYRDLPESAAVAYQALGFHHGAVFRLELVAAATHTTVDAARQAVDHLVDASLTDELDDGYFRLHDLVKAHAHAVAEADGQIQPREVRRRIAEWYLLAARAAARAVLPARRELPYQPSGDVVTGELDALRWMDRQRLDLVATVRASEAHNSPDLAYLLVDALQPLFLIHKNYRDAIETGIVALRAAKALGNSDAEASMRKRLARAYIRLNRFEDAHRQITTLLDTARSHGDRRREASGLKTLGMLYAQSGYFERAAEHFTEAMILMRGLDRPRAEGLVLIELGTVLTELGDLEAAEAHLRRARAILSALPAPDDLNIARAATALGMVHIHIGDHTLAHEELQGALSVLAELGFDADRGRTHQVLAELYASKGDVTAAQNHRDIARSLLARATNEDD